MYVNRIKCSGTKYYYFLFSVGFYPFSIDFVHAPFVFKTINYHIYFIQAFGSILVKKSNNNVCTWYIALSTLNKKKKETKREQKINKKNQKTRNNNNNNNNNKKNTMKQWYRIEWFNNLCSNWLLTSAKSGCERGL
jgi:hypothetical protein